MNTFVLNQSTTVSQGIEAGERPTIITQSRATHNWNEEFKRGRLESSTSLQPQLSHPWGGTTRFGLGFDNQSRASYAHTPRIGSDIFTVNSLYRSYIPALTEVLGIPGTREGDPLWNRFHMVGAGIGGLPSQRWSLRLQGQGGVFYLEKKLFQSAVQKRILSTNATLGHSVTPQSQGEFGAEITQVTTPGRETTQCSSAWIQESHTWSGQFNSRLRGGLLLQCGGGIRLSSPLFLGAVEIKLRQIPWEWQLLANRQFDATSPSQRTGVTSTVAFWESPRFAWTGELSRFVSRTPATLKLPRSNLAEDRGIALGAKWLPSWDFMWGAKAELRHTTPSNTPTTLSAIAFVEWTPQRERAE